MSLDSVYSTRTSQPQESAVSRLYAEGSNWVSEHAEALTATTVGLAGIAALVATRGRVSRFTNAGTRLEESGGGHAGAAVDEILRAKQEVFIYKGELLTPQRVEQLKLRELPSEQLRARGYQRKLASEIPERDMVNPIDRTATTQTKIAQISHLSKENVPLVRQFAQNLDRNAGTITSEPNLKDDAIIALKAMRPSIRDAKPWHDVEHVRDTLRFKTPFNSFQDLSKISDELKKSQFDIIKVDLGTLLDPKVRGWRMAAWHLRAPNGQIIEYQAVPKELSAASALHHGSWSRVREMSAAAMKKDSVQVAQNAEATATYTEAWQKYLARTGETRSELEKTVKGLQSIFGTPA